MTSHRVRGLCSFYSISSHFCIFTAVFYSLKSSFTAPAENTITHIHLECVSTIQLNDQSPWNFFLTKFLFSGRHCSFNFVRYYTKYSIILMDEQCKTAVSGRSMYSVYSAPMMKEYTGCPPSSASRSTSNVSSMYACTASNSSSVTSSPLISVMISVSSSQI